MPPARNFPGPAAFNCQVLMCGRRQWARGSAPPGSVNVYRPAARAAAAGVFRFSVVNSTTAPAWVTERAGAGASTYALSKADTTASYQARWWTTYGGVRPVLTVAGRSVVIEDGAGYEIYRTAAGAVAIRKLV